MSRRPLGLMDIINNTAQLVQAARIIFPPEPPQIPKPPPPNPMAGFADLADLEAYRMKDGAFLLGRLHPDHGANFPVGVHDDRHITLSAMSRGGKGDTLLLPNQILWKGPLFSIDPKGEAANATAARRGTREAAIGTGTSVRKFLGQKVAVLDPLGQVRGPARAYRVSYNPLWDIDMKRGGGVRSIYAIASALITGEAGNSAHFSETAETIVSGIVEAVLEKEKSHRQTFMECRKRLLDGREALLEFLSGVQTRAGLAAEAATLLAEVGDDEWGSHRSTLSRNLKWLSEPDMMDHLAPSDFSLRVAMQEGWSVFVVLPPEEMSRFKGWLRLIVRTALDAKIALGSSQFGQQTLCLLDEFPTLGTFPMIEESAGYMAGYGMKLVPIIQNVNQLKSLYPRNWETFMGNAAVHIAFAMNDQATESYIAERMGKIYVEETSASQSASGGGSGVSESQSANTSRHERPVRFANEVREQVARETGRAFIIPASGRAFSVQRVSYRTFDPEIYESVEFIEEWERRHWR